MRRAALIAAATLSAVVLLGGCGGGNDDGGEDTAAIEQEADIEVMEGILARQLGAVAAYEQIMSGLGGADLALSREFRAQEQEHVDALIKAIRGYNGEANPQPEEIEPPDELKGEADRLEFLYAIENATLVSELGAISQLNLAGLRSLLATIVANRGQHLVLLRRALGASPGESFPQAFETGTTPAP